MMRPRLPHPPPQWHKLTPTGMTLEYEVELITPMFGGGVKARTMDESMPIRAREVRGQLRFWWRLLAQQGAFPRVSASKLRDLENSTWGIADDNGATAGLIDVRIVCSRSESHSYGSFTWMDNRKEPHKSAFRYIPDTWLADHGLNYILFASKGELEKGRKKIKRHPDQYLKPPYCFKLVLDLSRATPAAEIEEIVRWWAAFGGVGARTRRGAGAIAVSREGMLLVPPTPVEIEKRKLGMRLVLGNAIGQGADQGLATWKQCANALFHFRQGRDFARNRGGALPGRSRWPEANAIRKIGRTARKKPDGTDFTPPEPVPLHFPRAAIGLPIQFQFKNEDGDYPRDPATHRLIPVRKNANGGIEELDRLASPIILKPMALANGRIAPIALRLPAAHVLSMDLRLQESIPPAWKDQWTSDEASWWTRVRTPYPSAIATPNVEADDPIEAFMDKCAELWDSVPSNASRT